MLVVTRTFHRNRRRLIHSFPGHLRRCNHQSNRLLDRVMDICRACHQTSDYHPSSLLHLVELLTLPWLSSSVKCSINPKQSSQAAMVPQDSLIRSGLSSLISCEMINSPKFLLMLHAHATKKHFLQATSRHRMISTLVEHSFFFPFFPHTSGNNSKPKFYYGTHIHLISFVKRYRNCIHYFLSWRNEVL